MLWLRTVGLRRRQLLEFARKERETRIMNNFLETDLTELRNSLEARYPNNTCCATYKLWKFDHREGHDITVELYVSNPIESEGLVYEFFTTYDKDGGDPIARAFDWLNSRRILFRSFSPTEAQP